VLGTLFETSFIASSSCTGDSTPYNECFYDRNLAPDHHYCDTSGWNQTIPSLYVDDYLASAVPLEETGGLVPVCETSLNAHSSCTGDCILYVEYFYDRTLVSILHNCATSGWNQAIRSLSTDNNLVSSTGNTSLLYYSPENVLVPCSQRTLKCH
jgi:hypothetical protein